MNWQKRLKGKLRVNEPLSKYTTFKMGGRARFLIEPRDVDDLKGLLAGLKKDRVPVLLIGAGSNLLISDKKIDAAVIRLSAGFFKKIRFKGRRLEAGGGVTLSSLLRYCISHALGGCEFLAGIPGTAAGALIMNAGIPGRNIGDMVIDVEVMDKRGCVLSLKKKDIDFGYRSSSLSRYIVLSLALRLSKTNKAQIRKRVKELLEYRRKGQDYSYPSAGCIFKNPSGSHALPAGKLIDMCGLKGAHIGGAYVCDKHANFILNKGNAKAHDIIKLMRLIQKKVKARFNIELKPEIKIWQ